VPSEPAELWERKQLPRFLEVLAQCRLEKSAAQSLFRRLCSAFDTELISIKWPSHAAQLLTRRLCDEGRPRASCEQFVASAREEAAFMREAAGGITHDSKRKLLDLCASLLLAGPMRSPKRARVRPRAATP
jgi:hypothetical protein